MESSWKFLIWKAGLTQLGYTHVAQYLDPTWLYMGGYKYGGGMILDFWKVPPDRANDPYLLIDTGQFGPVSFPFFQPVYPDS